MPVTTYPERRAHMESILSHYSGAPVAWPDTDFEIPVPTNDPANPARYIVPDFEDFQATTITMAGSADIRGNVLLYLFAEKRSGDGTIMAMAEALRTLFNTYADYQVAGEASSIAFLEPKLGNARQLGEPATWFGRTMTFPFIWLRG